MLSFILNSSLSSSLILELSLKHTKYIRQWPENKKEHFLKVSLNDEGTQKRADLTHLLISSPWASTFLLSPSRSSFSWLIFTTARSYFSLACAWNTKKQIRGFIEDFVWALSSEIKWSYLVLCWCAVQTRTSLLSSVTFLHLFCHLGQQLLKWDPSLGFHTDTGAPSLDLPQERLWDIIIISCDDHFMWCSIVY